MNPKILLIFLVFAFLGCTKEDATPKPDQEVFFQKEYLNSAWGFQQQGMLIDSTGKVWSYTLPEKWKFPDADGYISENDMHENLSKATLTSIVVDKAMLNSYYSKLGAAAKGKLSDPKSESFDAGLATFSGYTFNPKTKMYKRVLLRQTGDFYIENKSAEATAIYNWLFSLFPPAEN